jgi:lysophospholipase L1-like esterase
MTWHDVKNVSPRRFERYVAIGDSSTEGLDDPDGLGGYRGWANRLAQRIADAQGAVLYANLGIRGLLTREILDRQLAPAMAMKPDLATLFTGSNDLLRMRFDARRVAQDVAHMQRSLAEVGATVVTFTLPDLTPVMPMGWVFARRVRALNDALRSASASTGAVLVDFAMHAVGSDPRLWSEDGFHANADGHARIANALAHALGIPGADDSWMRSLPPAGRRSRGAQWGSEIAWGGRRLTDGWRALARREAKPEDRRPKRPQLEWVRAGDGPRG